MDASVRTNQSTFSSCMHDQMLESNRDDVKLEAMRCVTVMTAKGKLTVPRTLFPHIVKNVTSKNPELKKLIYLYLTSFADQEPDLALLPVASLQKSLKSPNPLVRSSALKVLTSMRLNILSAILMATLRNSVNDLSPYVRKTVAHSIIKIHRLDSTLRPDLIEYIERLLNDKNSMVLSSAVAAFEVVCPERLDLVQKHYRRFCFILADCNEWGQTLMLKHLVRFVLKSCKKTKDGISGTADHDPKILLRSAKPLVHSNNAAVVVAVVKLFIAIANHNEVRSTISRPLIRLLHSHRETQLVVLKMIEELTTVPQYETKDRANHKSDSPEPVISTDETEDRQDRKPEEVVPQETLKEEPLKEEIKSHTTAITHDGYIPLDDGVTTENDSHNVAQAATDTELNNLCEGDQSNSNDLSDGRAITESESKDVISKDKNEENVEGEHSEEDSEESESDEESQEDEEDEDEEEEEDEEDDDTTESESSEEDDSVDLCNDKSSTVLKSNTESDDDNTDGGKVDVAANFTDLRGNKDPNAYREIFRPYIKSFYVKHNDCTQIRLAKLKILTNLCSPMNVTQVLRELQAYISIYVEDTEFVTGAIHSIGQCALIVKEVAHTCLNGLTTLLSNNNEHVVSEAIVVLRSQIMNKKSFKKLKSNEKVQSSNGDLEKLNGSNQKSHDGQKEKHESGSDEDSDDGNGPNVDDNMMVSAVIKQVTRLLPKVTAPQARATILWILAEFCNKNITAAKSAANVLRLIAKSFCQEDNFVKLQALTLASKFILSLDKEQKPDLYNKVRLLAGYLFSLAKYDVNHDVRDRGRFLKKLLENEELCAKVLSVGGDSQEEKSAGLAA